MIVTSAAKAVAAKRRIGTTEVVPFLVVLQRKLCREPASSLPRVIAKWATAGQSPAYDPWYCSSLTLSIHSTTLPSFFS